MSDTLTYALFNVKNIFPQPKNSALRDFLSVQDEVIVPGDTLSDTTELVFQASVEIPPSYTKNFIGIPSFGKHLNPMPTSVTGGDWFVFIIMVCFALYAFLRRFFYVKQRMILGSFFSSRFTTQLIREGSIYNESGFYALIFLSLTTVSLLLHRWFLFFETSPPTLYFFFVIFISLISYYVLKLIVTSVLFNVLRLEKHQSEFMLSQHIFMITAGIVSLFSVSFVFFTANYYIVTATLVLFISVIIIQYVRIMRMGSSLGLMQLLYFFLYICTVEIMPILVVYKLINN